MPATPLKTVHYLSLSKAERAHIAKSFFSKARSFEECRDFCAKYSISPWNDEASLMGYHRAIEEVFFLEMAIFDLGFLGNIRYDLNSVK